MNWKKCCLSDWVVVTVLDFVFLYWGIIQAVAKIPFINLSVKKSRIL